MSQDEQHLNLLSLFHYIFGAMIALFACFPLIHVAVGILMLSGMLDGEDAPPRALGLLLVLLPAVFIFAGWVLAALVIVAGRKLRRRASRMFCMVVAGSSACSCHSARCWACSPSWCFRGSRSGSFLNRAEMPPQCPDPAALAISPPERPMKSRARPCYYPRA
jgi:hypothetical protein